MQVPTDDLRALVAQRTIDVVALPGAQPLLAVDLQLTAPLPLSLAARLDEEVAAAAARPIPGIVAPLAVHIQGDRLRFELDPLQPRALRLETFAAAIAFAGAPIGTGTAAAVVLTVASLVSHLHDDAGLRPHGDIQQGTILVSPGGAVALVGSGHPVMQALLLPSPPSSLDVPRAPELLRGDDLTPAGDVYALATVYAQLLAGRRASTPAPEAVPDPRPELVRLLTAALDPDPLARPRDAIEFGGLLRDELVSAGIALAGAADLDQLLVTYVPATVPSGNEVLLAAATPPEALEGYLTGAVPALNGGTAPEPPGPRRSVSGVAPATEVTAPPAASGNPWADVLGQEHVENATTEKSVPNPVVDDLRLPPPLPSRRPGGAAAGPPERGEAGRSTPERGDAGAPPNIETERAAARRPARPGLSLAEPAPSARTTATPRVRVARRAAPPTVTDQQPSPGWSRVLIATGGAVVLGLGLMSAMTFLRPAPSPATDPMPPASVASTGPDAGSSAPISTPPPRWEDIDSGVPAEKKSAQVSFLSVVSQPLGARVELDGEFLGVTPIVKRRSLPTTDYILRLTKDGFEPWQQVVRPGDNGALSVSAVLMPTSSRPSP